MQVNPKPLIQAPSEGTPHAWAKPKPVDVLGISGDLASLEALVQTQAGLIEGLQDRVTTLETA